MPVSWDDDFNGLQYAKVKDKADHMEFKMDHPSIKKFTEMEFRITFDGSQNVLHVRARKGEDLYGFDCEIKDAIDTSNLSGGLKKDGKSATLRVNKT